MRAPVACGDYRSKHITTAGCQERDPGRLRTRSGRQTPLQVWVNQAASGWGDVRKC